MRKSYPLAHDSRQYSGAMYPSDLTYNLRKIKVKSSTTTNVIDILAWMGKVTQSQVRPDRQLYYQTINIGFMD